MHHIVTPKSKFLSKWSMFVNYGLFKSLKLIKYIEKPPTIFHDKNTNTTLFPYSPPCFSILHTTLFTQEESPRNNPILNILGNDLIPSPLLLLPIKFETYYNIALLHKNNFNKHKVQCEATK